MKINSYSLSQSWMQGQTARIAWDQLENKIFWMAKKVCPRFFQASEPGDFWKLLFMEREKLSRGRDVYESEEPGYLLGMYKGYLHMLQTINDPLTPALYRELHDVVSEGVYSNEEGSNIPLGFRSVSDGAEAFRVIWGETLSRAGYDELLQRYKTYHYVDPMTGDLFYFLKEAMESPQNTIDLSGKRPSFLRLKPTRPETAEINVGACIHFFEQRPKRTEAEKLSAIVRLCQDLDQLHVFVDGNIRTTGILLLNRLLIQQDLSPCILEDVNVLDCLSERELVEKIWEGQAIFQRIFN